MGNDCSACCAQCIEDKIEVDANKNIDQVGIMSKGLA